MTGFALAYGLALALQQDRDGVLSMEEAVRIAEQNAFAVRTAIEDAEESDALARLSRAAVSPQANVNTVFQWFYTSGFGELQPSGSQTSTSLNLNLNQAIDISGVNRARIRAADLLADAADARVDVARNDVRNLVRTTYSSALQANELVEVQQAAVTANASRLEDARIREREGAIARFDVIRFESQLRQSEQALVEARGNLEVSKQNLNLAMGRAIETPITLEGEETFREAELDPAALVQVALANRPEVVSAEFTVEALRQSRLAEERERLPSLAVGANYGRNFDPSFGQAGSTAAAQATVSFPLLTGGAIEASTRAARQREERAMIQLEQLQLAVALEVRSAVTRYETAVEAYAAAQSNAELAREALRLAELRYREQAGIQLDVITAQADLTAAEAAVASAAFQVRIAYADLQRAVGADDLTQAPGDEPGSPTSTNQEGQEGLIR